MSTHHTIGRQQTFDKINRCDSDVLLFGLPGIGKTHVAANLPNVVFLNSTVVGPGLVDDLLSFRPSHVVVDDSGRKTSQIQLLREVREAENFDFKIVATCWPHQRSDVARNLNQPTEIHIDRLSRAEIGEILRARGIARTALIARILEQSDGRPGWAINLANLIIEHKDIHTAWSGIGLQAAVVTSIENLGLDRRALTVLGTLALIGELDERETPRFADLLGIPRIEMIELLESIATAGLIDVSLQRTYEVLRAVGQPMNLYGTQPGLMSASLACAVFFSEVSQPVSIAEVKTAFPEKVGSVLQRQCDSYHLNSQRNYLPDNEEIEHWGVLKQDTTLLQSFAAIGPRQSCFCAEATLRGVHDLLQKGNSGKALLLAEGFAASIGVMHWSDDSSVIQSFLGILNLLSTANVDYQNAIGKLITSLQYTMPGEVPSPKRKIEFLRSLREAAIPPEQETVFIRTLSRLATPVFEVSYLDPEQPATFVMTSGAWGIEELERIGELSTQIVRDMWGDLAPLSQSYLLDLLDGWVRIAYLGVTFRISDKQREAAKTVSLSLASFMAKSISDPGVRSRFNDVARPLGLGLEEPDRLFFALSEDLDFRLGTEAAIVHRDASITTALKPYLSCDPGVLMEWLNCHSDSLQLANSKDSIPNLFGVLANQQIDHLIWARSADTAGYTRESKPLIAESVKRGTLSISDVEDLASSKARFQTLLEAVIEHSDDSLVIRECLTRTSTKDFSGVHPYSILRSNALAREALFTHENVEIRSLCAAIWAASPALDVQDDAWRRAILQHDFCEQGCAASLYDEALQNILQHDVDLFAQLFRSHLLSSAEKHSINFTPWEYALDSADPRAKNKVWSQIKCSSQAADAFWAIARNDFAWAKSQTSDPGFKLTAKDLLESYSFTASTTYELMELVEVFRPLHPDAGGLALAMDSGMVSGSESEVLQQRLDILHQLSASDDPYLAEIGKKGVSLYAPRLARAYRRERIAEVRGRLI